MKIIEAFESLVSAKLGVIKGIVNIVRLEARLAELSIIPFLLSSILLLIVGMTCWISAMTLIGYGLFLAFDHFLYAIIAILILNLVCAIVLFRCLQSNLHKMSFGKTREIIADIEREHHEDLEKTSYHRHSKADKRITA